MRTGLPVNYQFPTALAQATYNSSVSRVCWLAQSTQSLLICSMNMLCDRYIDNWYPDHFSLYSAVRLFLRYLLHDLLSRPIRCILCLFIFFELFQKFLARTQRITLQ